MKKMFPFSKLRLKFKTTQKGKTFSDLFSSLFVLFHNNDISIRIGLKSGKRFPEETILKGDMKKKTYEYEVGCKNAVSLSVRMLRKLL